MSLDKKRRAQSFTYHPNGWGENPFPRIRPPNDPSPYYPRDFDDVPTEYREGSARYASWKQFKDAYPKNAELLIHLFGERDAIECHRHMVVVSEIKAATLCSFFSTTAVKSNRLSSVE